MEELQGGHWGRKCDMDTALQVLQKQQEVIIVYVITVLLQGLISLAELSENICLSAAITMLGF